MGSTTLKVLVELHDGRTVDVTHVPPGATVDYLIELGIRLEDIRHTVHHVRTWRDDEQEPTS